MQCVGSEWFMRLSDSDCILVNNVRVEGSHGCEGSERARLQHFRVDVTVRTDFAKAAASDSLQETIDYRKIIDIARRVVGGKSVHLLETLAERIASEILEIPRARAVRVRVTKLSPPIPEFDGTVSVEIERERQTN